MHTQQIGLFGASGYAGTELTALLAQHPHARVAFAASDRTTGTVEEATGIGGPVGRMAYVGFDEAMGLSRECAAVLLATPHEVSLSLVPRL